MKLLMWVSLIGSGIMLALCEILRWSNSEAVGWVIVFSVTITSLIVFALEDYEQGGGCKKRK